jgi:hypothetical protein
MLVYTFTCFIFQNTERILTEFGIEDVAYTVYEI